VLTAVPIDVTMGCFNVIWQGDANAMALASLAHAGTPALTLNLAGPELVSVRRVCERMAKQMNRLVRFTGTEAADALLSNGQRSHRLFGYPQVGIDQLTDWVADWVARGGESLAKPTHFDARDGKY